MKKDKVFEKSCTKNGKNSNSKWLIILNYSREMIITMSWKQFKIYLCPVLCLKKDMCNMYSYVTHMPGRNTLEGADNSKCNTIHIYSCIHLLRLLSGKCWEKYDMKYIKKSLALLEVWLVWTRHGTNRRLQKVFPDSRITSTHTCRKIWFGQLRLEVLASTSQ